MDTCFDCKYSHVHNGMQSCAWKSGMQSAYQKCDKYERDWTRVIMIVVWFIVLFVIFPLLVIYLILHCLGII